MTTRKIPLSHSDYWCLQAQEARLAAQLRTPRPGQTCSRRRMNMTCSPPATESGKPGCPLKRAATPATPRRRPVGGLEKTAASRGVKDRRRRTGRKNGNDARGTGLALTHRSAYGNRIVCWSPLPLVGGPLYDLAARRVRGKRGTRSADPTEFMGIECR